MTERIETYKNGEVIKHLKTGLLYTSLKDQTVGGEKHYPRIYLAAPTGRKVWGKPKNFGRTEFDINRFKD